MLVKSAGELVSIPMGRERVVLAQLVARVGRPVSVDVLVDGLWPGRPPASAERTLHALVARLRGRLEPGRVAREQSVIVTSGRNYLLDVDPQQVDAQRFEVLLRGAAEDVFEVSELRSALGWWRGAAFEGFDDVAICAEEGRRLDGLRIAATEMRVDLDLIDHVDATLVAELETLVAEHPFRERFWEQLILSLYRLGRQTEALAAYKRARRVLIDEIGVEPGPGLRHLEAAILDHDVSLLSAPRQRGRRVVPPALDASGSLFVGRDRDMATLLTWWSSCLSGAGGFVSVMGPDGAGKTRLAAELAGRVHVQNGVVLYARCDHAYVGPRLLFDAALRSQGSSITDVSVGTDGLAVATAQHLAAWRRDQPVLVVLDDLHLADAATLSAVAELAEWCSSMPVLIVGAFQADQYTATGDRQLVLGGLDSAAVAAICQLYRRDAWTGEDVSRVLAESGGLPLHVHRTAADVAEQSVIAQLGVDVARMTSAERAAASSRAAATDAVLGLRQLLERRHRHNRSIEPGEEDVNPYRGLARYEQHDATVFFGRERLVAELLVRLASSDLLAVVGSSGSGKSSLVRAGVLAALADGALPDSRGWRCAVITPGNDPRAELAGAIERNPGPGGRLFVIDQFEELYTVGHAPRLQTEFLDEVNRLAGTCDTRILIVVRSDQLVRVTEHPAIAGRMRDSTIVVGPLTGAEMRNVITGPAEQAGVTVEPALVDQIVADSSGEAGALPLVSTALAATWERRSGGRLSVSGYNEAGRVSGAIAQLADDAWEAMPDMMRARGTTGVPAARAPRRRCRRGDPPAGQPARRGTDRGHSRSARTDGRASPPHPRRRDGRDHPRGAAAGMAATCGLARRGRGGSAAPVPSHGRRRTLGTRWR